MIKTSWKSTSSQQRSQSQHGGALYLVAADLACPPRSLDPHSTHIPATFLIPLCTIKLYSAAASHLSPLDAVIHCSVLIVTYRPLSSLITSARPFRHPASCIYILPRMNEHERFPRLTYANLNAVSYPVHPPTGHPLTLSALLYRRNTAHAITPATAPHV